VDANALGAELGRDVASFAIAAGITMNCSRSYVS
jgi:hypothetical protein